MIDDVKSEDLEDLSIEGDGLNVKERHVDYLLQEELKVDPAFLRNFVNTAAKSYADPAANSNESKSIPAFIEAARQRGGKLRLVSIKHSVSDIHGEADLIVVYQIDGTNERVAILIEDKIHARFQDRQASRYKERGVDGEKTPRKWDHHWTCLVAPESYIKRGHGFDASVKLEVIREWFASNDSGRAEFKVEVVKNAIMKASITGVKVVDEGMTAFRNRYCEAFREYFGDQLSDVYMLPRTKDYGDVWFKIYSHTLELAKGYINHKSSFGFVDLTFRNTNAKLLDNDPILKSILEPDMMVEQTGKSAAIRLSVTKIEDFRCFDDQIVIVEKAFIAVQRLLGFYVREQSRLDLVLLNVRTTAKNQSK